MNLAVLIFMLIGAIFIAIFSIPNLIVICKTKNTHGVNIWMYMLFGLAGVAFCIYSIGMISDKNLEGGLPILISNIFCVIVAIITLIMKFRNMHRAKKEHLTELQYWEKYHKKQEEIK